MALTHRAAIFFTALAFMLISAIASFAETISYTYDDMHQLTKAQYGDGTTVEYVYDNLGNRLVKTTALPGAPANNPPNAVSSPTPQNSTTEVSTVSTLSWTGGGDPDTSDAVVYSVYFGTASSDLPLVATGFQTSFVPGQLKALTTYYWKVVAKDNHNVVTEGPLWSFITTNDAPVASFSADKTSGWAPLKVIFTDSSQSLDDEIVSWAWDFDGDGLIDSTNRNPAHIYPSWGAYTVTLTVTDAHGATTSKTMPAYINVYDIEHIDPDTVIHCVTNAPELQSALTLAQNNGKDNVLRLVQGTYRVSENNNQMFHYNSAGSYRLYLMGGYTAGCSSRELNPANTVLDGGNIDQGWSSGGVLYLGDGHTTLLSGFMEISGVTMQNGKAYRGGGLYLYTTAGSAALANSVIKNNTATGYAGGGGAYVGGGMGSVTIINNVIAHNTAVSDYGGILVKIGYNGHVNLINNTISNNTFTTPGGTAGGVYIDPYDPAAVVEIHNNIIWNNPGASGSEIYLDNDWSGAGTINAYNNDFDPAKLYSTFTNQGNNINADPLFVNAAAGDYSLMPASPARDVGNNSAPFLPPTDIVGTARIIGSAVDMGAYEYITTTGSIVINNGDDYTTSPSVTLTLSALNPTDVSQMCISNTPDCSAWEAYSATKGWTLPAGDGIKTVYAWYKNDLGIVINQSSFKDLIVLDGTPPVINISTFSDGSYTYNAFFGDVITGVVSDNTGIQSFSINGAAVPIVPPGNFTYNMQLTVGTNTITSVSTDLAGNQAFDTRTITLFDAEHPSPNAVFQCVSNGAELQSALTIARSNNKDNVIQLVQGTYKISENNNNAFFYIRYSSQEPHALYLKGGYTSGCATRELNPANTILDGENIVGIISLSEYPNDGRGYVEVDGITMQNGKMNSSNACILINSANGSVALKNSIIKNNNSQYQYGNIGSNNGTVIISNNTINNNTALSGINGGIHVYGKSLFHINNTLVDNIVITAGGNAGISIYSTVLASMYNNIIRNNTAPSGIEISWGGSGTFNAYNNDFDQTKVSGTFTNSANNINAAPLFVNAIAGDYRLSFASPAINAGNNAAPFLPPTDVGGHARVYGSTVDMGAYEFNPTSDTTPPTGSIIINNDASYTSSSTVTLTLAATDPYGVFQMCISDTDTCTAWEAYATAKAWTLPTGDGAKHVYAWFKDGVGNPSQTPYAATITLDTLPPPVTINPVTSPTASPGQTLAGTVEAGATVTVAVNTAASPGTVTYPTTTTWQCEVTGLVPGDNIFTVTARDAANNTSNAAVTINYQPVMSAALSPQTITSNFAGLVTLTVNYLSSAGSLAFVEQFIDANRNGSIDSGDYVIRSFKVTDGIVSTNPNVQGDTDGDANKGVTTNLNYFLTGDLYHAPGNYLLRVSSGAAIAVAQLSVTAVSQLQSISGVVSDGSTPLPGAMIRVADKWQRPVAFAIADAAGQYSVNIKEPGDYYITALAYGFATGSAQTVTSVAAGQSIVGHDLTLTPGVYHLTGQVRDETTLAGIGGVWVTAGSADHSGVAMTGADGSYDLFLPAGQYAVAAACDITLPNSNTKGYLCFAKQSVAVNLTAAATAVDLTLIPASVFVSGKVQDASGQGAPGLPVQARLPAAIDSREPVAYAVTNAGGDYTLGIFAGNGWDIALNDPAAQTSGYLGTMIGDFSTTTSPLTGNNLTAQPLTAWVQGSVKDSANNPLAGVEVQLRNADSSIRTSVKTASDGTYLLGAYAGNWLVDALTEKANLSPVPEQNLTLSDGMTVTVAMKVPLHGDFNGDGKPDILWRNTSTGENLVWYMDGVTQTNASIQAVTDLNWQIVSMADFNGDGKPDILWRNTVTGENAVWCMDGITRTESVYLDTVTDLNWQIVSVVDFNGDGKPDILWRNTSTGENIVWYMDGTTKTEFVYLTTVTDLNWQIVSVVDFNSDGKPDILWRNTATGENVVWCMDWITWMESVYLTSVTDLNWQIVSVVDFNSDGKADILWRNTATGENAVWCMDGITWMESVYLTTVTDLNWQIVSVVDFSSDGKPDILWRNAATGENAVWYMDGVTWMESVYLTPVTDLNWQIVGQ